MVFAIVWRLIRYGSAQFNAEHAAHLLWPPFSIRQQTVSVNYWTISLPIRLSFLCFFLLFALFGLFFLFFFVCVSFFSSLLFSPFCFVSYLYFFGFFLSIPLFLSLFLILSRFLSISITFICFSVFQFRINFFFHLDQKRYFYWIRKIDGQSPYITAFQWRAAFGRSKLSPITIIFHSFFWKFYNDVYFVWLGGLQSLRRQIIHFILCSSDLNYDWYMCFDAVGRSTMIFMFKL